MEPSDVSIPQPWQGAQSPPCPKPGSAKGVSNPSPFLFVSAAQINAGVLWLLPSLGLAQVCVEHRPVGGLRSLPLLAAMKELNTKSSVGSNCEVWKFLVRQINWI